LDGPRWLNGDTEMNMQKTNEDRELTTAELELVAGGHDTGDDIIAAVFCGVGPLVGFGAYVIGEPVGYLKAGLHKY
jgi:hypothetical protein